MLAVWTLFVITGVMTFREAAREEAKPSAKFTATKVIGLGVAAWIVEREALVAGHSVGNGVALAASLLMPFAFIAAWLLVVGREAQKRRGWLMLSVLAVALTALRIF